MLVQPYETCNRLHPLYDWDDGEIRRLIRGTKIETLMVGKSGSGNQLVIYNRRSEQAAKRQGALFESYGLDAHDKSWGLWRVEVRFSGDVLKRRWNVRRVEALQANLQAMLNKALTRVRYVTEDVGTAPADTRALHPIWHTFINAVPFASCTQPSQFAPERAEYLIRQERERSLKANVAGCSLRLAAMRTQDPKIAARLAPELAHRAVANAIVSDPDRPNEAILRERMTS